MLMYFCIIESSCHSLNLSFRVGICDAGISSAFLFSFNSPMVNVSLKKFDPLFKIKTRIKSEERLIG